MGGNKNGLAGTIEAANQFLELAVTRGVYDRGTLFAKSSLSTSDSGLYSCGLALIRKHVWLPGGNS